jgi:hypothetical protein
MFRRLIKFLARVPEQEVVIEEHYVPENTVDLAALEAFARLVTRHLGPDESERLTRRALTHADDILAAFEGDQDDDDGQREDSWLVIQIDWKAYDEIQWQADLMLATRAVEQRWGWDMPEEMHQRSAMHALKSLARWLDARGLALLHIDSGGDDYHALIVAQDDAAEALRLGVAADIAIQSHADFLIAQQD